MGRETERGERARLYVIKSQKGKNGKRTLVIKPDKKIIFMTTETSITTQNGTRIRPKHRPKCGRDIPSYGGQGDGRRP